MRIILLAYLLAYLLADYNGTPCAAYFDYYYYYSQED